MAHTDTCPENVEREIDSLYGIAEGINANICAYGYCDHSNVLRNETGFRDYRFDITYDSHQRRIELLIDTYQVPDGEEWDVDAWEAGKVRFGFTPKNSLRHAFRAVSGIARALLNGRGVDFPDGRTVCLRELTGVQS